LRYQTAARDGRMVRSGRYKYVVFRTGANREQLFDLELDPGEIQNLARRPEGAAELARHRQMLAEWSAKTGDRFTAEG
jgi:arylsulfatase A-like enzyme